MFASSSIFRPYLKRVIRDLFRLLHAVRHGTEGRGSLKYPAIECLTLGLSREMNGVTLPIVTKLCVMPRSFNIKLHCETQVSGRLGMSGGKSPRHAQNPLSGE